MPRCMAIGATHAGFRGTPRTAIAARTRVMILPLIILALTAWHSWAAAVVLLAAGPLSEIGRMGSAAKRIVPMVGGEKWLRLGGKPSSPLRPSW